MVSKTQKIRLGVFLFLSFIFLAFLIFSIIGNKLFEKRDIYFLKFKDVSVNGLQIGGSVKYHGIKVGRVDEISIGEKDISEIIITLSLESGTPVKKDVTATLIAVGITGLKSVELLGGSNNSEKINKGSFIPTGVSTFDNITGKAEVIAEKIELVLNNIIDLTSGENKTKIEGIIGSVDQLLADNLGGIKNTISNVDLITANLSDFTAELNTTLKHTNKILASGDVQNILSNTSAFSDSLQKIDIATLSTDVTKSIKQMNSLISNVNITVLKGRADLLSSLETLKETLDNLNEFSRLISENPSILLRNKGD